MPDSSLSLGIDGCRGGWVAVAIRPNGTANCQVFPQLSSLWLTYGPLAVAWIDMPIGLLDGPVPGGRSADQLARRILSPHRHSSIFTPPCRAALYAAPAEASAINFECTGKKLSRQTLNIMPKIKELDTFLLSQSQAIQACFYEAHPELVFAFMNGGKPLSAYKKTSDGQAQRTTLLQQHWPPAREFFAAHLDQLPRATVQPDDLLDAMALAVAAWLVAQGRASHQTLPPVPPLDRQGLPMGLSYPQL